MSNAVPIVTLIAALVAALVAIYNARVQRFISEKWWERKADAYTRLIEALSALLECDDRHYEDALHIQDLSDTDRERLTEKWQRANEEVTRATYVATFLLSERAREILRQRAKTVSVNRSANWVSDIEKNSEATALCLAEIVTCATHDLRVKAFHPFWRRSRVSRLRAASK